MIVGAFAVSDVRRSHTRPTESASRPSARPDVRARKPQALRQCGQLQPANRRAQAQRPSDLVLGLDERSPAGCRFGESPFFEHVQRPPRRPSRHAVLIGELGHRGHLLTGPQLSVLNLLPDLVSYPQVRRLRTAGLAHTIMIKPGKPSHSVTWLRLNEVV